MEQRLAELPDTMAERLAKEEAAAEERASLQRRINVLRSAQAILREVDPQIDTLTKELAVLSPIRQEFCQVLLTCQSHTRDAAEQERARGLRIGILLIDGRFDVNDEAIPTNLPLFEKLQAAGYAAPIATAWNPMSAFSGSLAYIAKRVQELQRRRDEAQE